MRTLLGEPRRGFREIAATEAYDGDPEYVEGAIAIEIDGAPLLAAEEWDDVNWLWPQLVGAAQACEVDGTSAMWFPDQPLTLHLRRSRLDPDHVELALEAEDLSRKATARWPVFLDAVARAGLDYYANMERLVPGSSSSAAEKNVVATLRRLAGVSAPIADTLSDVAAAWARPRRREGDPFRLVCRVRDPASDAQIDADWGSARLPAGVLDFWSCARTAELFVDVDYGQWGLRLLDPARSAERTSRERTARPDQMLTGDVVLGEFLGDAELLVLDGGGRPRVALPLDPRRAWPAPALDLAEFLARLAREAGDKFWDRR